MREKISFMAFVPIIIVLFACNALSQVPNLIARWPLDESSGGNVEDTVGNNDGKLIGGPDWVQANFGNGLQFTKGTGQYAEIPRVPELEPVSMTAMVWVNVKSAAGRQEIFCYGDSYVIHIDAGVFKAYIHKGGAFPRTTWKTNVETNKWYLLAATYDKTDLKLYVNGKFDGSAKLPGGVDYLGLPLRFSNNPAAPAESWGVQGIVDEVEIWDKALTEDEIMMAYESPLYFLSVNSRGKLATVWGKLKDRG